MGSRPLRVDSARQTFKSMPLAIVRTLASIMATLTNPEW
jgi:hypothetical protein